MWKASILGKALSGRPGAVYLDYPGQLVSRHVSEEEVRLRAAAPEITRPHPDPARWTPGRQMWIMQADGSQAQALSSEEAYNHYDFIWSTDGNQIAFVRSDPTQLIQPPELWLVNPDGSNPIQLVKGGYSPIWIP